MILPCLRCPKTVKNHLVAKRHRDSQHNSQMTSKSVQFWYQNGSKFGPKMVSEMIIEFLLCLGFLMPKLGPNMGPKMAPNLVPKWGQLPRCAPGAPSGPQNGPKMAPESQNGPKMAPKWFQNVTFGSGLPLIHGTWQVQADARSVNNYTTSYKII